MTQNDSYTLILVPDENNISFEPVSKNAKIDEVQNENPNLRNRKKFFHLVISAKLFQNSEQDITTLFSYLYVEQPKHYYVREAMQSLINREAGLFNRKRNGFDQFDLYTREGYSVSAILEAYHLVYITRKSTENDTPGWKKCSTKWGTPEVINQINCKKQEIPELCPVPSPKTNSYYGFNIELNRNRGKYRPLWEARSPLSKMDPNKNIPPRRNSDLSSSSTSRSLKLQDMLRNFDTSGGSAKDILVIPGEICVVRIETSSNRIYKRGRIVPKMHYSKHSELRIYLSDESKSIQADHKDVFPVNYKMHSNLIEAIQLRRPEEPLEEFEITDNNLRCCMKKSEYDRILELKQILTSNELRWETLAAKTDGFQAAITSILDPAHIFITPIAFLEQIANEKESKMRKRIDVWDFMATIIKNVQKSEDFFKIEQPSSVNWDEMIRKRKLFSVHLLNENCSYYIRARIISKMENLKDGLLVLDVDTGTICRVPLHSISYLPDSIVQIPPLCFPVSPAHLDFKPENWEQTQIHMNTILNRFKTIIKIKQQDQYGSKCHSTKIASRYSTVDIMLTPKPIRDRFTLDRPHLDQPIEISLKSVLTSSQPDLFFSCRNQSVAHQQPICIRTEEAKCTEPLSVEFFPDILPSEIFKEKPNEAQTSERLYENQNPSPELHFENEPELLDYVVRFSSFVCSEYPNTLKKLVTYNEKGNDQFTKLDLKLTNLLPEENSSKIICELVHFENRNEIKVFWKAPKYEILQNSKNENKILTKCINGDEYADSAGFDRHMSHLIESFNPHQFNDESLLERGTKGILRFHNKYSRAVIVERNQNKWIYYLFDRGFHVFSGYNLMLKTENDSSLMEIECPIICLQPSRQAADMVNACIDAIDPLYGPIDPLQKDHRPFLAASSFEIENIIDDMDQILKLCCFTLNKQHQLDRRQLMCQIERRPINCSKYTCSSISTTFT